jgi:DNA-binding transcriptional MerR regulator
MRSGQLARVAGVSTDTLRHYERLGLLAIPSRTSGGYRNYPPASLDRVHLIRRALSIGFSLSELKAILQIRDRGGVPCRRVRMIAQARLLQVNEQIKDLFRMRSHLNRILKDWDARLRRTRAGQRARLLENLSSELVPGAPRTRFSSRQRKKGR